MDLTALRDAVARLISEHKVEFDTLGRREAQALEIGALVLAVEHFRRIGFVARAQNLRDQAFKVKVSARGYPRNFSWYEVQRGQLRYEIHANLAVESATQDDAGCGRGCRPGRCHP